MHSKAVISRTEGQEDLSVLLDHSLSITGQSPCRNRARKSDAVTAARSHLAFLPKTVPPIPTTDNKTLCLCGGVVKSLENSNSSAVPVGSGFTAGLQDRKQSR